MDTMSRAEKGRVAPPPQLGRVAQGVANAVAQLPDVIVQAHWEIGSETEVNGTDFYVGEHELGHIHLDGEAHVPIGSGLAKVLIKAKIARRFRWNDDFVAVDTTSDTALWLFGLRRTQIAGATDQELLDRVKRFDEDRPGLGER